MMKCIHKLREVNSRLIHSTSKTYSHDTLCARVLAQTTRVVTPVKDRIKAAVQKGGLT